jgi:hypothetical protein
MSALGDLRELWGRDPERARRLLASGRHRRAGYDRDWVDDWIDWSRYRAQVGVGRCVGPWSVETLHVERGDPTWTVCVAEGLPCVEGVFTVLEHRDRGCVMADTPAEVAGALEFLEHAHGRVLISGLGLGVVPAFLLRFGDVESVDVIELDRDVIELVAGGCGGAGGLGGGSAVADSPWGCVYVRSPAGSSMSRGMTSGTSRSPRTCRECGGCGRVGMAVWASNGAGTRRSARRRQSASGPEP